VVDIDQLQVLQRSFDDVTRKLDDSLQEEVLLRQKVDLLGKVLDDEKLINKIRNKDQMTKYYTPSSTDISLGYPGDGLTDELDVQCYVPWTSSDNPNVATYDIKMRYP
jgi:hypothetical protein